MKKLLLTIAMLSAPFSALSYECSFDNILSTTPTEKFLLNGNGTVTDLRFGLMWTICTYGQVYSDTNGPSCIGDGLNTTSWSGALSSQNTLNDAEFAGFDDWRLPNIKELQTLVERACKNPAIRSEIFPDSINAVYWSNTPDNEVNPQLKGRIVDFADGSEFFKATSEKLFIRHVRSINQ